MNQSTVDAVEREEPVEGTTPVKTVEQLLDEQAFDPTTVGHHVFDDYNRWIDLT